MSRSFQRLEPSRDAKFIYLFCEGSRTEPDYFSRFEELDSRIKVQVIAPGQNDNNSPTGLLDKAIHLLEVSDTSQFSQFELLAEDEVWFIIDTDSWGSHINRLYEACNARPNWEVAQSNPCFEVWLYYHLFDTLNDDNVSMTSQQWKKFLNVQATPKYDPRKHFVLIGTAIANAQKNFTLIEGQPAVGSTYVYKPAESIYSVARKRIDRMLHETDF